MMRFSLYVASILVAFMPFAHAASTDDKACDVLAPHVQALLFSYSRKDTDAVMNLSDSEKLLVLGTDISEIADTRQKARNLLADDFALWGSSSFGAPTWMSCRVGTDFATAAFDVPFTMNRKGGRADTMTIRFLTVWHHVHGRWFLTQSLNSVPTVGQSASDILKQPRKSR